MVLLFRYNQAAMRSCWGTKTWIPPYSPKSQKPFWWRLIMVVPLHQLFVAWCMMELEERRGRTRDSLERQVDCWESSAPAWDRAHHPYHGNITVTFAITKICSRGASIMESETTTHLIALTVVDSYLKQAASYCKVKGSVVLF